jgi:hypothetical protein
MPALSAEIVIINCSTRELTSLALASALRHGGLPVTVVDCESTDGSVGYFRQLQQQLSFKLAHLPLRPHGETLDRIFRETESDSLLLLDSDAEILDANLVPRMRAAMSAGVYGSGFLHAGEWLAAIHSGGERKGWYAERMWIPCVLLDAAAIKEALAAGQTFRPSVIGNELPGRPWLSTLLQLRFRIPGLRTMSFDFLRSTRRKFAGMTPHYIQFDTGARMHDFLVNQRRLAFADLGAQWWPTAVAHYHGVTRRQLRPWMRNAADVARSRADAAARVESHYGVRLPK